MTTTKPRTPRQTAPGGVHGTNAAYIKGCGCELCTAAHTARITAERRRRYAITAANGGIAPVWRHNANTYANWGCRCDPCKDDRAVRARVSRPRWAAAGA